MLIILRLQRKPSKTCLLLPLLFLVVTSRPNARAQNVDDFFLQTDDLGKKRICLDAVEKNDLQADVISQAITLQTKSKQNVPALFFDRKSDVALIVGQALPGTKESMLVYAQLFDGYDVILFDYRWSNKYFSSLFKSIVLCNPIKYMLLDEEEEIYAVLEFIAKHKTYEKIVGIGECYSNFLFAKVQADCVKVQGTGPFTHLIFDSCWHSLGAIAESICDDPFLPFRPQTGGAPWIIKQITGSPLIKWPLLKIVFTLLQDISVEKYLPFVGIPVLFIYGRDDIFVPKQHFESIWNSTGAGKRAALLTPYNHSNNLQNKQIYKFVCEQLVNASSIEGFQENAKMLFRVY